MRPLRQHANGVPWLIWVEDGWICEECGRSGRLPPCRAVAPFARVLGDLKRYHAHCRPGAIAAVPEGAIGDPLNLNRVER